MSKDNPTGALEPFERARAAVALETTGSFQRVEDIFLQAMWEFDQHVINGLADQGDIQNGKGDFFNDFLVTLLAKCSDRDLSPRPNVPGLSFKNHKLDAAYPTTGTLQFVVETKATGTPRHARNTRQKNAGGRRGSADLEKRVKEAVFKNIDIKGETARLAGRGGGATSELQKWLKETLPRSYIFLSCRVIDDSDLRKCEDFARIASVWFDGAGLFCYAPNAAQTAYERREVHTTIELDRVLSTVCTELRQLPVAH